MADGTLNFDTKVDASGMNEGASQIGNIIKGIGIEKLLSGAIDKTVELGKKVVTTGMGFETSMSQVAATMGITTDEIANGSVEFTKLSNAAKKMGATTQFSASQSADALNYLALAGYDADTAIETLPTILNLAAAGGMELGRASDMVTDAMSALGLETKDASGFVDKMAKTSQKSNTSVSQLGDAILTVGGSAKILKGGTTELSGLNLITAVHNGINLLVGNVIRTVSDLIKNCLQKITEKFSEYLKAGSDLMKNVKEGITNTADTVRTAAETAAKNALQAIKNLYGQFMTAGQGLIKKIAEGIKSTVSKLITAAGECVKSIKEAFNVDWASVGANIINGIKNGITNLASSLAETAASAAKSALNAAKSFLGIHSPSTKFRYLGEMSVEGMKLGFRKSTPEMRKSIQSDINDVMNSLRTLNVRSGTTAIPLTQ